MDKIVLKGCGSLDGEWEVDLGSLTHRELHVVKRISGVRVGELEEAAHANDTDVLVALAIVALQRHGRQVDEDLLWDSEVGGIAYIADTNEIAEQVDPTLPPETPRNNGGSGGATSTSSDLPESLPSPTGAPI